MKFEENFTFSELQYVEFAVNTSRNMNFFFSVTVLPIGVVLNILSGIVFLRKSLNNKTNMGFLCAIFCLFNTIALLSAILMNSFMYNYIELADSSKSACQFFSLWNSWTLHMPSFQQVIMSLDVFMSVNYPNRFQSFRTKKNYLRVIILMVFLTFLVNLSYLFNNYDITFESDLNKTTNLTENKTEIRSCSSYEAIGLMEDIINVLMRNVIPFVIMLTLNILMSRKLFTSRKILGKIASLKKEYQFAISIVAMNFFFLIIYIPWSIAFVIYHVYAFLPNLANLYLIEIFKFFQTIANCLAYINNFSVFFTNILFNYLFRNELLFILRIRKDNKITSSNMATRTTSNAET
jgi:hypothetical protein